MARLDVTIVERGLAPSRTKAQRLIETGSVEVDLGGGWTRAKDSAQSVEAETPIRIVGAPDELKYVSRGGLKLEGALKKISRQNLSGVTALDVGQSTGGFTDCLLSHGCDFVYGIEVGQGQLDARLQNHPKIQTWTGVNIRDVKSRPEILSKIQSEVQFCVVDVSFISLKLVIPELAALLPQHDCELLLLVKPQFELGREALDRHGVVRDSAAYPALESKIREYLTSAKFEVQSYFSSEPKGQDGNQEFFCYAIRST